ncbi:MAG: sensor histidine kinase [Propioniciclava sp.]
MADPGVLRTVVRAALLARLMSLLLLSLAGIPAVWWVMAGPIVIAFVGLSLLLSPRLRAIFSAHPALVLLDAGIIAAVAAGTGANHPFIITFMTSALLVGLWLRVGFGLVVLDALLILYLVVLLPGLAGEPIAGLVIPFMLVVLWWLGYAVQRADRATREAHSELERTVARSATLSERTRLARDMHDTFAKTLQAISLTASALPDIVRRDPDAGQRYAAELQQMSTQAVQEARLIMQELRYEPTGASFTADLERACHEWSESSTAHLVTDFDETVDPSDTTMRVHFLRSLEEALENVRRHAEASTVSVTLRQHKDVVELTIQDDGVGVTELTASRAEEAGHFGRRGMAERMTGIGGTMNFVSEPGHGTRVVLAAPLVPQQEGAAA